MTLHGVLGGLISERAYIGVGGGGGLILSGIKKSFLNELIRNKLRLTKSIIKMRLPLSFIQLWDDTINP